MHEISGGGIRAHAQPYVTHVEPEMPFSAEAVLLTLRTELRGLDKQINEIRETMEDRTGAAKDVMKEIRELKGLKNELFGDKDKVKVKKLSIEQRRELERLGIDLKGMAPTEAEVAWAEGVLAGSRVGPSPYPESTIARAKEILEAPNGKVRSEHIDNRISELNTQLEEINAGNEQQMIKMQQLISQRQVEVQLATNALRSISEGQKNVASNIGR